MRFYKPQVHSTVFFFALLLFAASIPLSNFLMSTAQWILVLNLFLGQGLVEKLKKLWRNKAALILIGFFLLHALGLIWSADMDYALKDLRVKLPVLVLTFVLGAEQAVNSRQFRWIMVVHALAVLAGSLFICSRVYFFDVHDMREASSLISHIRFALNVCLAIFSISFLVFRDKYFKWQGRMAMAVIGLWLLVFLLILEAITGFAVFGLVALALLLRELFTRTPFYVKVITAVLLVVLVSITCYVFIKVYWSNFKTEKVNPVELQYFSPRGNPYIHNINNLQKENGNYLWLYVCTSELKESWNQRSSIPYDSLDLSGQQLKFTLVRYLTSKGYRKDKDGVESLTDEEVSAIEKGIANVDDLEHPGFMRKIEKLIWELNDYGYTGDPSGHSVMQRVELWGAAWRIFLKNPVIGVGTGDVPAAFDAELKAMNSPIQGQGLRAHNQYLAILVAFGIPGLLYFLLALFYGPVRKNLFRSYYFFSFFLIAILSMISEDTLESQAGVSFIMFFLALMLFADLPDISPTPKNK